MAPASCQWLSRVQVYCCSQTSGSATAAASSGLVRLWLCLAWAKARAAARDSSEWRGNSAGFGRRWVGTGAGDPLCFLSESVIPRLLGLCDAAHQAGEPVWEHAFASIHVQLGRTHPLKEGVQVNVF